MRAFAPRLTCAVVLLLAASAATLADPPTVLYELEPQSEFQEGCFPPCLCPILAPVVLEGSFGVTRTPGAASVRTFALSDVSWRVPVLGYELTGSGTLVQEVGGERLQRLLLDLSINGGPVERYDSGPVPVDEPLPAIAAMLSIRQLVCFDRLLDVRARPRAPRPRLEVQPGAVSWSDPSYGEAYDLVSGDVRVARVDLAAGVTGCLGDDVVENPLPLIGAPPIGDVWFFAMRPGAGTYDANSIGQLSGRDLALELAPSGCP